MIRRCVLLDSCTNFALQKAARAPSVRTGAAFLLGMTGRRRLQRFRPQFLQKRFATRRQPFFEPFRTIAIAARPRFGPVFVTTITTRMRVFHRQEIKIFFPIGTLFLKRGVTKASFYPMRLALGIHARHLHVVQVLVARD